jgi:hypothetical protein
MPFSLAHGGAQIQIERTKAGLEGLGVEVEPLRWWDEGQTGEILHHFGRVPRNLLQVAQGKGMKVVTAPVMSGLGARPGWLRFLQRVLVRTALLTAPGLAASWTEWGVYRLADACVALTPFEASLMRKIFDAPPGRIHFVPNGVEEVFLKEGKRAGGPWLVCTASIIEMKQVLKLAEMAVRAKTPLWVIGKAHAESDDYAQRFKAFAKQHSGVVRYEGAIADRQRLADVYREARGFVLLSRWEGLSLSALEAAACGCPLLLSNLPWAREFFKDRATYCPHDGSVQACARILRSFYEAAPGLEPPPPPMSWGDVARQLKAVYESLLRNS